VVNLNRYQYYVFEEDLPHPDGGRYRTYGIRLQVFDGRCIQISDVSTNRKEVERMVAVFNCQQLDAVHFYDAVEDMIV
jgi:hypothetical protein